MDEPRKDPKEIENAGDATVQRMREGDFVDGEPAGPYGGADARQATTGGEQPSSTSEPAQVAHASDHQGESSSAGGDGNG